MKNITITVDEEVARWARVWAAEHVYVDPGRFQKNRRRAACADAGTERWQAVKRALISDIHANVEALQKVLEDIRQQGVTEIYCLGDIIGYGPNPCECLDQVMQTCEVTILGNHDQAALFDPDGFNPVALQAVYWTREQLERRDINAQSRGRALGLPGRVAAFLQ